MAERTLEETTAGNGHHEDTPVPEPTTPRNESTLERLRAKRAEKAHEATPLELPIPGYDGELVCKYRPLTWGELKKIGEKVDKSKNPARELYAHCDTLILACQGLYVREKGELQPLDPSGEPIGYSDGDRLAGALGFEPKTSARETVLQVFALAHTPGLAVSAQHNELAEWMQGSNSDADEETLGES